MTLWQQVRQYIPTLITISRLFSPGLLIWLFAGRHTEWFWITTVFFALTDVLDGWLARTWKCETTVGAALDILADKVYCITLMGFGFVVWDFAPWFVIPCVVLVLYHFLVLMLRVIGIIIFSSSNVAKAKMVVEMSGLIICLGSFGLGNVVPWIDHAGALTIWTAGVLAFWSGFHYLGWAPDLRLVSSSARKTA